MRRNYQFSSFYSLCKLETEMLASSGNLGTEQPVQSVDSEMTDVPCQNVDIEMPDVPQDENAVSSENGINQLGRGRPPTSSVDQSNLCNSSDAMSRGGESIPHGQEDLRSEVNNGGGIFNQCNIAQLYLFGPQEWAVLNTIPAAPEHQCSPGFDGEDTTMLGTAEYECDFCKAREEYHRTAGQNNVHCITVPS